MTLRHFLVAAALSFAVSTNAYAGDMIEIAETGLASIDDVFSPVADIHTQLADTRTKLADIDTNIRTALGVAEDSPLETALADLKAQAGDALTFEMDGTTPKLSIADGADVPENVTNGVTALQTAFGDLSTIITELPTLTDKVMEAKNNGQALVADPKALISQAKDSGMKGKEAMGALKTAKSNLKATGQTPDHITSTTSEATTLLDTLTAPFKG